MIAAQLEAPPVGGASLRTTVYNLKDIEAEIPSWFGQDCALDFETSGLSYMKDRIVGVALTFADGRSYYIVIAHTWLTWEPHGDDFYALRTFCPIESVTPLLQDLLAQSDITVAAHNWKFELHFLTRLGIEVECRMVDTMLAAQLIDENRRVGLKALAPLVGMELNEYKTLEHYPGFKPYEILGVPLNLVADYAMDDTEATWKLWQLFQQQMNEEGVEDAFYAIWMPCLRALQEMEARGIALDMEKVHEAKDAYGEMADNALEAMWQDGMAMVLAKLAGQEDWTALPERYLSKLRDVEHLGTVLDDTFIVRGVEIPALRKERKSFLPRVPWFNPGSVEQLLELLFDWHGIKVDTDIELSLNAKGDVSADKDTLKVIAYELGDEAPAVLQDILTYRKATKLLSTYLKPFIERGDEDDHFCLRTNFNQAATDTGRLSSSSPNLQNQPSRGPEGKLVRSLCIARPGYQLVVADYSMMELRVAAHYANDQEMMRAFREGLDLHSLTAANQIGMAYEEFAANYETDPALKQARQIGKTSNFGLLYGMGPKKFQRYLLVQNGVKVTQDEAWALIEGFNTTYAGITKWKRQTIRFIEKHGYVPTFGGRKRRLPDINSTDMAKRRTAERQGINARVQGGCADIICEAIPAIQSVMQEFGGSLLLQVHDELVAEVPTAYAESAARIMERMMVEKANRTLTVPLVVEAGIGPSWASAKD
jgi:DNA polymerase I-like protein with 3'-5' exonuclease and polymerase domains